MKTTMWTLGFCCVCSVLAMGQEPAKQPAEPAPAKKDHPSAPPPAAASATANGTPLALTGITFTVPKNWKAEQIAASPMGPKAVFEIPSLSPGSERGAVRITHFPEMKGKDDMNIDRWVAQVAKDDGKPATRKDAEIKVTEMGNIRLTTVDVSGSVKMTMRETARPNNRMIAAIVDHPKGPHFVVAAGDVKSMETWAGEIMAFLKSVKVTESSH